VARIIRLIVQPDIRRDGRLLLEAANLLLLSMDAGSLRQVLRMDDLPHSTPEEVAKRLRSLAEGLTDPGDIAAINKYVDELERKANAPLFTFEQRLTELEALAADA
jgi:nitrate reductase assembly molybdenum cofactor insertion protein NarJ